MDKKVKYSDKYIRIGLNIAYYRKLRGMTQLQLAEAVNISRTHMSNIEAPNIPTSVSLDTLFEIAEVLDVDITSLFDIKKVLIFKTADTTKKTPTWYLPFLNRISWLFLHSFRTTSLFG